MDLLNLQYIRQIYYECQINEIGDQLIRLSNILIDLTSNLSAR